MKIYNITPAIILTSFMLTLTTACTHAGEINTTEAETSTQAETRQLSTEVVAGLKQMYEEEKLASDVYKNLYDKWQIQAFSNIYSTELRHQQAVKELLDTYGIAVDERLPIGEFKDENLQKVYDDLMATGMQSEQAALMVGAYVEELDIEDLNRLLTFDNPDDVRHTYEWLNMGSRNHLRAFVHNMNNRGIDYVPQLLDEQEYLVIINSEHERGGRKDNGFGHKRGHGNS